MAKIIKLDQAQASAVFAAASCNVGFAVEGNLHATRETENTVRLQMGSPPDHENIIVAVPSYVTFVIAG